MKQFARVAVMFVVGLIVATPALAGVADSPLPVLEAGKKTYHLYSVPGVLSWIGMNLATYFACTSTDTATMQVGVEVFDSNAFLSNDAAATSFSLVAGQSVLFGTHQSFNELFDVSLNTGDISGYTGSARILATSRKLICTAFLADHSASPSPSMVYLTVIKKTTQKGE
jgi:hypothetical protein